MTEGSIAGVVGLLRGVVWGLNLWGNMWDLWHRRKGEKAGAVMLVGGDSVGQGGAVIWQGRGRGAEK